MTYRNTIQKQLVLETVRSMTNHPTAEEIYGKITMQHPTISKGTVYRNLNLLADQGEILRVQIPNTADRFDFNTAHHYHVRCQHCGKVFDVSIPYFENLEKNINQTDGFLLLSHDIVFSGICPSCQTTPN